MVERTFIVFDMSVFEKIWLSIVKAFNGFIENIDSFLFSIIKIVLIIIAARVLIRILCAIVKKSFLRRAAKRPESLAAKKYNTIITLTQSIIRYLIDFIMIVMILDVLGLGGTIGSLLATAGIGGVALGLGAQSFLKDFLGGLFMLFDDEYAVGDYIKIPSLGMEGTVSAITLRNTSLRLVHGEIATIPHGNIDVIINYTRDSYSLFLNYDIAGDQDDIQASEIILGVINEWLEKNNVENAEPEYLGIANMNSFKSTLKFVFRLPPLKQWQAERDINKGVLQGLKKSGVKLPEYQKGIFVNKEGA